MIPRAKKSPLAVFTASGLRRVGLSSLAYKRLLQTTGYGVTVRTTGIVIDFAGFAYSMTLISPT